MTTYEFRTEPRDHQRRALRRVIEQGGRQLLTIDAGLGKTWIVLNYAAMIAQKKGRCAVFVAAPLSAVDTWEDEANKHVPLRINVVTHVINDGSTLEKAQRIKDIEMPDADPSDPHLVIVAINLDVFSQNRRVRGTKTVKTRDKVIAAVRSHEWDLGIIDESHRIKSNSSNVSRAMGVLADAFPRRLGLTGTVAPHSPMDFWGQMRWVEPDILDRWSDYKMLYARFGGYGGKEIVGFHNLEHLSYRLKDWVFPAKREDCLDLPPVTHAKIIVDLSTKERKAYTEMAKEALAELESGTTVIAPAAITKWMKLRQITSGFLKDEDAIYDLGSTKMDACVDKVSDLVAGDEKVVVFAHFIRDVKGCHERLTKRLDCPVEIIHGSVDAPERRRIRKMFQSHDGPMVVVAQMRTVSLAVNEFVAASNALFLSYSERHDDYIQAVARLDRQGQTRPVTIWHIIARNSLDESLLDAYDRKGTLEQAVLAEASKMRSRA